MALLLETGQRRARGVRQPAGRFDKLVERRPIRTLQEPQDLRGLVWCLRRAWLLALLRRDSLAFDVVLRVGNRSLRLASHAARTLAGSRLCHGWSPVGAAQSLLPPPRALPIASVRAAAGQAGRDSLQQQCFLCGRSRMVSLGPLCAHFGRPKQRPGCPKPDASSAGGRSN